jgi:hypothetical protein
MDDHLLYVGWYSSITDYIQPHQQMIFTWCARYSSTVADFLPSKTIFIQEGRISFMMANDNQPLGMIINHCGWLYYICAWIHQLRQMKLSIINFGRFRFFLKKNLVFSGFSNEFKIFFQLIQGFLYLLL